MNPHGRIPRDAAVCMNPVRRKSATNPEDSAPAAVGETESEERAKSLRETISHGKILQY